MQTDLFKDKQDIKESDFTIDARKHTSCHHELKHGEIWVGNTTVLNGIKIPEYLSGLNTARLGEQAYYLNKTPIERWYMRPLIIHSSESGDYDKIMMERAFGKK